jgi:hypothetical protein
MAISCFLWFGDFPTHRIADDIAYADSSASFTIQLVELRQLSYFVFSPWVRCNAAPR